MKIYAIGDLHLPGGTDKPMHVFGMHWKDHWQKIRGDWLHRVRDNDVVIIPGDISWAMRLEDAACDLRSIGDLPGFKVISRGNHDYWWSSIQKIRALLPARMFAIQNDALALAGTVFCGTRGWQSGTSDPTDIKIWHRETMRMRMSLEAAKKLGDHIIAMMHYPPFGDKQNEFVELFQEFGVSHVYYGHLHGQALRGAFHGLKDGIFYHQVSCDRLEFTLYCAEEEENRG